MTDPTKGTRNVLPEPPNHRPRCPICGARATNSTSHTNPQGVVSVHYVCPHEHGWLTQWVAESWPAAS